MWWREECEGGVGSVVEGGVGRCEGGVGRCEDGVGSVVEGGV